ncbi:MAG TPA: hydantoinase/oxoprolinase family protein [Burkholderiales bacterium]|nr:hydantoinase/oxoprolinase family protein [Burkholderiales bacterium]
MDQAATRLGVDIGGTFTDIVMISQEGTVYSKKLLSTPADYSAAIEDGIGALCAELGLDVRRVSEFVHATTVATNTIIERKGVKVALVTTSGFRDVLELARFRAPRPYDVRFRKPEPLVPRQLRFEVVERIGADGQIVRPLETESLEHIAQALEHADVKALAICFINSCANNAHEVQAAEFFARRLPGVSVTASTALLPQLGEYERTSSTVINAYIRPVVKNYVDSLERRLQSLKIAAPLMIMQSSGGIAPGAMVSSTPITIIESGPAAGVLGGQRLGLHTGMRDMIVFDMGGTTAKATIIEDFQFGVSREAEVGGGAVLGQRMIKGAGYPVQVPTIDIAEVGAGGGSIAAVDDAGGIKVGPHSAGADPGPVCYDHGGTQPTVSDANLLLGYLHADALVGGELPLNFGKARESISRIGGQLNLDVTEAAYGIHQIANATMLRALRAISSERGRDPAKFVLFAIGGNGPVHAATLAEAGGLTHVVVPPVAGLFSALGMLFADVEHQLVKSLYKPVRKASLEEFNAVAAGLVASGRKLLTEEGFTSADRQRIQISVDMKYIGQTSPLAVPLAAYPAQAGAFDDLVAAFEAEHAKVFGYVPSGDALQFVALKAVCSGEPETPRMPAQVRRGNERRVKAVERKAFYGEEHGWLTTPVISRADLGPAARPGPLIIEEYDTTVIVRPAWTARTDAWNNIHMERAA